MIIEKYDIINYPYDWGEYKVIDKFIDYNEFREMFRPDNEPIDFDWIILLKKVK